MLKREIISICGSRYPLPYGDELNSDELHKQITCAAIYVEQFVRHLNVRTIICTGAAKSGVDNWARQKAIKTGHDFIDVPANWERYKSAAGFRRNPIVAELGDKVLAVWDGESKGTKHTIDCSIKLGKPVRIIVIGLDAKPRRMAMEEYEGLDPSLF